MRVSFFIKVLPRQPQVHGDAALTLKNACRPKHFTYRFPACAAFFGGDQHGHAQMIGVQVVVARLFARQAVVLHLGLPDGVGAP